MIFSSFRADVDDVNDMDQSTDTVEQSLGSMQRREFLTKAAAVGAIAWVAPVILSRPAWAVDGGGGTLHCRPAFKLECTLVSCGQGNKQFPGFKVSPSPLNCPCSNTMPPQRAVTCIKILPKEGQTTFMCGTDTVVAYGSGTDCHPLQSQQHNQNPDVILNTGSWECFDSTEPVFFGKVRSAGGAISNLESCDLEFRVAVWAGKCPDGTSADDAFVCQTFNAKICYDSAGTSRVSCSPTSPPAPPGFLCPGGGFTPATTTQSLCTETPADQPPCCPPIKPVGPNQTCCPPTPSP
jgi:hypothetical protein